MNEISKYNLEHMGVKCTEVRWCKRPIEFQFVYNGNYIVYKQQEQYHCNADTDHIRCVIEEFLGANNTLTKLKPRTNFDKITESVENLAEFLHKLSEECQHHNCMWCDLRDCNCCDFNCITEWLQKECE